MLYIVQLISNGYYFPTAAVREFSVNVSVIFLQNNIHPQAAITFHVYKPFKNVYT